MTVALALGFGAVWFASVLAICAFFQGAHRFDEPPGPSHSPRDEAVRPHAAPVEPATAQRGAQNQNRSGAFLPDRHYSNN